MEDFEIIGSLKSFVKKSIAGAGALEGAPCQIQSIVDSDDTHTITFLWKDNNGDDHTSTLVVHDGADGSDGAPGSDGADGADGYSPSIAVKTSSGNTYILTITNADGSFNTPNLHGQDGILGSISVNGVAQTIENNAVNLNVADNLITDSQWTALATLWAVE